MCQLWALYVVMKRPFLWPPCVEDADIIFALWFLSFFFLLFPSPDLSRRTFDVYHTSTYDVVLVRI